jgi:hypothetical protein
MKVTEESPHFAKMSAHGVGELVFPAESEKPR